MTDNEKLLKQVETQEKQISQLRRAFDILTKRLIDTDKRARRNSENLRRHGNDINTIKRKLGSK